MFYGFFHFFFAARRKENRQKSIWKSRYKLETMKAVKASYGRLRNSTDVFHSTVLLLHTQGVNEPYRPDEGVLKENIFSV